MIFNKTSKLAVGSVFTGHPNSEFWYELQIDALRKCTEGFDHFVYLNGADSSNYSSSIIVGQRDDPKPMSHGHLDGLNAIIDVISGMDYKSFLLLDSDAFPVCSGWQEYLDEKLELFGKKYAAPVRAENLDTFPHPCVLYTRDRSMLRVSMESGKNLLGLNVNDTRCAGDADALFPMLKSNVYSLHQTLCTVYNGVFYHHGCGSRDYDMRSSSCGYRVSRSGEELLDDLKSSPSQFLGKLRGRAAFGA